MVSPFTNILTLAILEYRVQLHPNEESKPNASMIFRNRILTFLGVKFFLLILAILGVWWLFKNNRVNDDSSEVREESKRKGLGVQFCELQKDGIFFFFVFMPLFSIVVIAATSKHLFSIMSQFGYSNVRALRI